MSPRVVKEADERRVELLDTAMRLFTERGYDNVPVQAITEEVSVAKGTFYHYFASKGELLDALIERQAAILLAEAKRRCADCGGDAVAKFRAVIDTFAVWKMENWGVMRAVIRTMYSDANAVIRQRFLDRDTEALARLLASVITEGANEGCFVTRDPAGAAEALLWLWHGMAGPMAAALLECDDVTGAEIVVARLRTSEMAIERILGARPGSLGIYDYERIRGALTARDLGHEVTKA